jgi:hypothetical protein
MSEDIFLERLRNEREALVALLEPLDRRGLISGDAEASEIALRSYKRQLLELDALIAVEECRCAERPQWTETPWAHGDTMSGGGGQPKLNM